MTLDEAKTVARTLRRQLVLASISRIILIVLLTASFLTAILQPEAKAGKDALWFAAMLAAITWVTLTMFSVRQLRAANQAAMYISSGRLDLAEEQLKNAVHLFSFYRAGKLLACHNLAVVVHGRKNYSAAAELCTCVISLKGKLSRGAGRLCRILLADCRLLLGDPAAALQAIGPLSLTEPATPDPQHAAGKAASAGDEGKALDLAEQMLLLPIELRCHVGLGKFEQAVEGLDWKVQLAELLDAQKAALVHALLAEACRRVGKPIQAGFLQRRAELYSDLEELAKEYPFVVHSAPRPDNADNNTENAS
jgi:hypothetical protein